jgi:hypothetical protein
MQKSVYFSWEISTSYQEFIFFGLNFVDHVFVNLQEVLRISGDAWRQLPESERRAYATGQKPSAKKEEALNGKSLNGKHSTETESTPKPTNGKSSPESTQDGQIPPASGVGGLPQGGRDAEKDKSRLKKVCGMRMR